MSIQLASSDCTCCEPLKVWESTYSSRSWGEKKTQTGRIVWKIASPLFSFVLYCWNNEWSALVKAPNVFTCSVLHCCHFSRLNYQMHQSICYIKPSRRVFNVTGILPDIKGELDNFSTLPPVLVLQLSQCLQHGCITGSLANVQSKKLPQDPNVT